MPEPLILFHDIAIRIPHEGVFSNISFELREGEHWAFVGENEALKTALIEGLAGNAALVGGRAGFPFLEKHRADAGNDPFFSPQRFIAKVADRHSFRNLSNVSQFYYQQRFNSSDSEDALTVQEYLEGNRTAGSPAALDLATIIDRMKLGPLLDKQLIKLSNGETKRLLIAAALLRHPRILLLVNPFTGLDGETRGELREIINEVAASGITVILSAGLGDLPKAITHVALFEKNNRITTAKKESVVRDADRAEEESLIDRAEVASLLTLGNRPPFNDIVVMKNVRIRYGEKRILDGINWTVKSGERWALLGPNGAGKSTLLSLINGDNPPGLCQ